SGRGELHSRWLPMQSKNKAVALTRRQFVAAGVLGGAALEENLARTVGSIGESVAAGAIFTVPAFLIAGSWTSFDPGQAYWKSTALMTVGGILGVLFVSLVRRTLVEDPDLPFPESVAASEIHKA